jgi:serine protease AprX
LEDISQKNYIIYSRNLEELQNLGIEILEDYSFISAFLVKLTTEQYNLLKKINKTIFPVENQKVQSQIYDAKKFINVSKFYRQGFFGKGVTVAVIDTGVEPIFDLSIPFNRILEFKDFTS